MSIPYVPSCNAYREANPSQIPGTVDPCGLFDMAQNISVEIVDIKDIMKKTSCKTYANQRNKAPTLRHYELQLKMCPCLYVNIIK